MDDHYFQQIQSEIDKIQGESNSNNSNDTTHDSDGSNETFKQIETNTPKENKEITTKQSAVPDYLVQRHQTVQYF